MADDSTLGLGLDNPAYQDLITKQQEAIKAANQPYGMNAGQGAIAAGLGLLPALIGGLVRGREGLAIGAQAGLAGVGSYDSILKENFERQSKAEAANADLYGQQAQQLAQSALQDQRFMAQEGLRQQNRIDLLGMRKSLGLDGGTTIINDLGEKQVPKIAESHYEAFQEALASKNTNDRIRNVINKLEASGATGDEGYLEAVGRTMKGKIDPSSPEGELQSLRTEALLGRMKALIKGVPSDRDTKLMEEAGQQGAATRLSTIKEIANRIDELNYERLKAAEDVASMYKSELPSLSSKLASGSSDSKSEEIDFNQLRTEAKKQGIPIVKQVVGGKIIDVYDYGKDKPLGQRYLPVRSE